MIADDRSDFSTIPRKKIYGSDICFFRGANMTDYKSMTAHGFIYLSSS